MRVPGNDFSRGHKTRVGRATFSQHLKVVRRQRQNIPLKSPAPRLEFHRLRSTARNPNSRRSRPYRKRIDQRLQRVPSQNPRHPARCRCSRCSVTLDRRRSRLPNGSCRSYAAKGCPHRAAEPVSPSGPSAAIPSRPPLLSMVRPARTVKARDCPLGAAAELLSPPFPEGR